MIGFPMKMMQTQDLVTTVLAALSLISGKPIQLALPSLTTLVMSLDNTDVKELNVETINQTTDTMEFATRMAVILTTGEWVIRLTMALAAALLWTPPSL